MARIRKSWTPEHWASLMPFGLGYQRPNNFWEVFRAIGENRDRLGYAWRILNEGVCDGCALGTTGMRDWTLDGTHLCNIRLRLLRMNTMGELDPHLLSDVDSLSRMSSSQLRALGRIPFPMRRRKGEQRFTRISWENALDVIASRLRRTSPEQFGVYVTSRGMTNEGYYAIQKAVRALGSNNVDNAARVCHSPSTTALKESVGAAATTCSYADWIDSDLIVFIGSNVANNQPVATKYIHYAKKNGCRVVMVNPYREPGMERYWIPSIPESALFGTRIADRFFQINQGQDVAFLSGALKHLLSSGLYHHDFVENRTVGFEELKRHVEAMPWKKIESACGAKRSEIMSFAQMVADAKRAVFVWSMGVTQHEHGVSNVRAIVNLALTQGFVGRRGCGLMPIRGHSGVQGGAEMGCYSTAFPGGRAVNEQNARDLSDLYGFEVPSRPGLTAPRMIEAASRNAMDILISVGGNFLEVLPGPEWVRESLARVPLRVHLDIVLSSQMLVDPGEEVIVLPATTRYEVRGGVTQTSTERRVIFSPEIRGPRIREARFEGEVFHELAALARPDLEDIFRWKGTSSIRREISRVVPFYDGIQNLHRHGDQFQYGGAHLCEGWNFPTPDGKAHFACVDLPEMAERGETFHVSTRRGKQFNSMVQDSRDAITGATRESILMANEDAQRLHLRNGDRVMLSNDCGRFQGRILIAPLKKGNLQIHWPEGNVLIDRGRCSADAGVPDYNATVILERDPTPKAKQGDHG